MLLEIIFTNKNILRAKTFKGNTHPMSNDLGFCQYLKWSTEFPYQAYNKAVVYCLSPDKDVR